MGTPHYLSPEQAQGFDVTAVSDLYSVGVMLYEALTGRVPFEAESAVAVAMKQVSQMPQRPSSINPRVSPGARRGGDAGAGEGPRAALPERRRLHRRARRGDARTGGAGGGTADFAALPPVVAVPRRRARRTPRRSAGAAATGWILAALVAILIGALIGICADPRHHHRSAERDRQRSCSGPKRCSNSDGFRSASVKQVERQVGGGHRARAGPGRLAARRRGRRRLLLPHPLLLEAGGDADGQHRARQQARCRRSPASAAKRRRKLEAAGFEVAGRKRSTPTTVEEGTGDPLRTRRRARPRPTARP